MARLDPYNSKRRFLRTPEPVGEIGHTDEDHLRFVVQRHFASREHFDLRLEHDGVLLSWAVPEGPSLRTTDRRLAIATEDHPLDYLEFEGVIPEGEYGAGELAIWDSGTWVPVTYPVDEALASGELKIRLAGRRLNGGWTLVKLPKGETEWLWIKERDTHVADRDIVSETPKKRLRRKGLVLPGKTAAMPKSVKPMLAGSAPSPPEGADWIHEIKHDGYRVMLRIEGGEVRALTRNGHDWTKKFQTIAAAAQGLDCDSAILDGEVVVQDALGRSSFTALQKALGGDGDGTMLCYAFDLLYLNGHDLRGEPLLTRKAWLRRLLAPGEGGLLQFSDHFTGEGRSLFAQACRLGLEGIVSKKAGARYQERRSDDWLKVKRYDVGRFAVVGFTTRASPRHVASLLLAEEDGGAFVGGVASGLANDWAAELFATLSPLATDEPSVETKPPANARWIAPGLFEAEVSYRGGTGRGAVRQGSLLAVRGLSPEAEPRRKPRRLVTDRDLASIRLTNPDREVLEGSGTTKLDIALFYARVGDHMLPQLVNRPATLIRCTTGKIEDCFYQRHAMKGLPGGVDVVHDAKGTEILVIRNARGLLGLSQFGTIEFHLWDCQADRLEGPDRFTIDLDPDEALDWPNIAAAAFMIRERLQAVGLTAFVRTTGGKGLHLVVPLAGEPGWKPVKDYLKALSAALVVDAPGLFVAASQKVSRKGRIFLDMGRTAHGASAVASYSLRARPGFPVSVPLDWAELQQHTNRPEFNRKSAIIRVESGRSDPWADLDDARAEIGAAALRDVGAQGRK